MHDAEDGRREQPCGHHAVPCARRFEQHAAEDHLLEKRGHHHDRHDRPRPAPVDVRHLGHQAQQRLQHDRRREHEEHPPEQQHGIQPAPGETRHDRRAVPPPAVEEESRERHGHRHEIGHGIEMPGGDLLRRAYRLVGAGQQLRIGPFAPRQPCHGSPQALRQQEDTEENQVVHHHGEFSVVVPYLIIVRLIARRLRRLSGGHGFPNGSPLFFFCHNRLLLSIRSESKDSASQGQKQIYLLRQGRSPFSEKISKFRLRLWISILNH